MAAVLNGVLEQSLAENVKNSKLLVVGAGGIGCEVLKNLVLTGFKSIEVIDLDTIDVSNLNRQFLFRKEHVGKSKAEVARESVLKFNPDVNITAYHDSIFNPEYDVSFFKKFTMVMNALDNRAARNHVNRMCLAADIPLVESGTAGYLGQVTVIKKGLTECYECQPKAPQKSFPGCTIRNTPSEPIHCVVWAKHLFNQLFGEEDPDQDVSPDTEDPELTAEAGQSALSSKPKENEGGGIERKSTRVWAMETGYNPEKLFNKLFRDDIKYLLSMETLWKKRRPPTPLSLDSLPTHTEDSGTSSMRDQRMWSVKECYDKFAECLGSLKRELSAQGEGGMLVWDKDDTVAMDFVASVANIRAHIFGIPMKTRFDIKSMAGNIIPAIATTNAVIAGLLIVEAFKILQGRLNACKTVYMNRVPNDRHRLLIPCTLDPPNPKCYVCAPKPEVTVVLNTTKFKVGALQDKILKSYLGMVAPDVEIDDGKGTILISSEEGETEDNNEKFLSEFGIRNGTRLKCDDFLQVYTLVITIAQVEKLEDEKEFEVVGDLSELQPKEQQQTNGGKKQTNGNKPGPSKGLRIRLKPPPPPPKVSKTNAQRCLEYRQKIKVDPERYALLCLEDMQRSQRYRQRPVSEEEAQRRRDLARIRQQKFRKRKEAQGAANSTASARLSTPVDKRVTRAQEKEAVAAVTAQRKKWAEKKRIQREKLSAQKKRRHREGALECYHQRKGNRRSANDEEDDLMVVEDEEFEEQQQAAQGEGIARKRKASDDTDLSAASKRKKVSDSASGDGDVVEIS